MKAGFILLIVLVGCADRFTSPTADPTPQKSEEEWVLNAKGAPLFMRGFAHGYSISNTSKAEIVSFALGCVRLENGEYRILKSFASEEGPLRPKEETIRGRIDAIPDEKVECVEKRKAKLTVLNTKFADNQSWTFPGH